MQRHVDALAGFVADDDDAACGGRFHARCHRECGDGRKGWTEVRCEATRWPEARHPLRRVSTLGTREADAIHRVAGDAARGLVRGTSCGAVRTLARHPVRWNGTGFRHVPQLLALEAGTVEPMSEHTDQARLCRCGLFASLASAAATVRGDGKRGSSVPVLVASPATAASRMTRHSWPGNGRCMSNPIDDTVPLSAGLLLLEFASVFRVQ